MENSARELGFVFDKSYLCKQLQIALAGSMQDMRVRLTLAQDGKCSVEAFPFADLPDGTVWRLAIASTRIKSTDPLLRHKTSLRHIYEEARAEFSPDQADEVILLNEKGEVCEGTITNLFVLFENDVWLTPEVECGLLPGILRKELLDAGKVREAKIALPELFNAQSLFVGNSLRGLIPAKL